jgi:hypothetical protein
LALNLSPKELERLADMPVTSTPAESAFGRLRHFRIKCVNGYVSKLAAVTKAQYNKTMSFLVMLLTGASASRAYAQGTHGVIKKERHKRKAVDGGAFEETRARGLAHMARQRAARQEQ